MPGRDAASESESVIAAEDFYRYGGQRIDAKTNYGGEKRKYAGTEYDSLSGLNYAMARYQSPTRGQFISEDPSLLAVGTPKLLALALPACGESTEAKLDRCKAEMKTEFQQSLATARQEADKQAKALLKPGDPVAKDAMEQLKKMAEDMRSQMEAAAAKLEQAIDADLKKWQGAAGLAECEKTLGASRKARALRGP